MTNKEAIGKVTAILLVDIIILSLASGTYLYLQTSGQLETQLKPAEFFLADLKIDPVEADVGEPIQISANVTNIGDIAGNYTLSLIVNDVIAENQTIRLVHRKFHATIR